VPASILSVFACEWAIALTCSGLAMITRFTKGVRTRDTAMQLPVASMTTSSVASGRVAEAANYKHELAAQRTRTACPHFRAPGASVPDGRTIRLVHDEQSRTSVPDIFILVTNAIERLHEEFKRRIKELSLNLGDGRVRRQRLELSA
jgi:hypothetical protein